MSFLHRFLSEDLFNCKLCLEELNDAGVCSSVCLDECPSLCKIVQSPAPVIHHDYDFRRILIIGVSSTFTTLFLVSLLVLCYKYYNRRRRSIAITRRWSMDEARNWDFNGPSSPVIIDHPIWHIRTIGLNPTVISSIKVCKYNKKSGVVEGTDCSVCLSEFEEEETLRLLPKCRHAFHLSCIDTWLRSHTNCPLCRAPIVVANSAVINDDNEVVEEIHVRIPEEETDEEIERDHEEERDAFVSSINGDIGEVDESKQQRVRRSVSFDSLSGLRESEGRGKERVKRGNIGSSIVGRSSFLKRSISYSGK